MTPPADSSPRPAAPLIRFEGVTFSRAGTDFVLSDFDWTLQEGETWAIVGPTGSGKTTVAELVAGRHHPASGSLSWPFVERLRNQGREVGWPSAVIRLVSFREESWLFSPARHYYQQRFNFIEPHEDLTLDAFLRAGAVGSEAECVQAAARLGVESLLPLSLIKLSNGQMRRARVARALLAKPELLILDDPFLGLDVEGRDTLTTLLGGLVRQGTRLLLICRRDDLPAWVTHVLDLGASPPWTGKRADLAKGGRIAIPAVTPLADSPAGGPILELRNVNVAYGDRPVLCDVSWTVHEGERWAVLGPNGSGKTTLLSLLSGDHPQAYANDIRLFGRQRGSGESIWDIKKNVGLVSPEMHVYFTEPLSATQAAATGFFDVLAPRRTTAEQDRVVRGLFEFFGLLAMADRPFGRLSTGQQRLVLLIRALVKRPPLLILDEPFQGLDRIHIEQARDWLDRELRPDQTLLFVTHYPEEIPHCVNRILRLDAGRVVEQRSEREE